MASLVYKFKWVRNNLIIKEGRYVVPYAITPGTPPIITTPIRSTSFTGLSLLSPTIQAYIGQLEQNFSFLCNRQWRISEAVNVLGLQDLYYVTDFEEGDRWVFSNGNYIQFSNIVKDDIDISASHRSSRESVDYAYYNANGTPISGLSDTWLAFASSVNDTGYPASQGMHLLPWTYGQNFICQTIGAGGMVQIGNNIRPDYCYITNQSRLYQETTILASAFFDGVKPADTDNPYEDAGTSDEGGGDPNEQNFDDDSDDVEEDAMPDLSAVGTGFATLFTPTKAQLKSLADIMWGAQWWQALQNQVEGIDKMFVSLGIMPFVITPGSTVEVTWLGLSITEVYLTLAAQQYFEFDMGSIDLSNDSRIWTSDTAMDYSPFCRLGIYLPFIGFQDIDIDECRGKVLNLKYRIDALSGSCVALIKVGDSTLYQFTGNCMVQIPITSQSFDEFISTVTNVAIAGTNVKTAQALAGGGDNVAAEAYTREKNPISEAQGRYQVMQHAAMVSHAENGLASATANAISGLKPSYNKSGAVSASNALMAVKQPYLFLSSPNVCVPEHYQRYGGFPANITDTLGNFEGFTVVNSIRLNGLVATAPEVEEIYELLHSGVII